MELFPQEKPEEDKDGQVGMKTEGHFVDSRLSHADVLAPSMLSVDPLQIRGMGLVVVRDSKVIGLHCSGAELHAGQAAIIQHGTNLADCELYFSRRPCATCLKMIINGERKGQRTEWWCGEMLKAMLNMHCTV